MCRYSFGDLLRLKKRFDEDDLIDEGEGGEFDDAEQWAFRVGLDAMIGINVTSKEYDLHGYSIRFYAMELERMITVKTIHRHGSEIPNDRFTEYEKAILAKMSLGLYLTLELLGEEL